MASCELLNKINQLVAQVGRGFEANASCPFLDIGLCEGTEPQPSSVRALPSCAAIGTETMPSDKGIERPSRVDLFNARMLVTQTGRRPLVNPRIF